MEHRKKVLAATFISDDQTTEVLQPGKESLYFPPSPIPLEPTSILRWILAVATMWGDQLDAIEAQFLVEAVGVVGVVADQVLRRLGNNHL